MFYDERIEFERGRISRNCIVLSVLVALIYGAVNLINMLINIENPGFRQFFHLGIEAVIIVSGTICLAIGFFKGIFAKDERTKTERNIFYNKAVLVHLCAVFTAWALLMPFAAAYPLPGINFMAMPYDYVLYLLFFPIVAYCVYSFKKYEIYFNYSLLESGHYYKGVFKNLAKFGKYTLIFLLISLFSLSVVFIFRLTYTESLYAVLKYTLSVLITYIFVFITVAALYLFLSMLEKASYDNETRLLSKSTVVSFIVAACLTVAVFFITLASGNIINALANSALPLDFPLSSVVAAANYVINYIKSAIYLFAVLCITYFYYEYRRVHKNRLLTGALCTILIIKSADTVLSPLYRIIIVIAKTVGASNAETMGAMYMERTLSEVYLYYTYLIGFAEVVAVMLIIAALIKDGTAHKGCIVLICVSALMLGVMLFLTTQLASTELSQAMALFHSFIYICLAVLLAIIGRKNTHSIDK